MLSSGVTFGKEKDMKVYIPYEKLSKKKKRELDRSMRSTWGAISPVTRVPVNKKAYNRKKAQRRFDDPDL